MSTTTTGQNLTHAEDEIEYVTVSPISASISTPNDSMYFSPIDLSQSNQSGLPQSDAECEYVQMDPVPGPSTSDLNMYFSPGDVHPQNPSGRGPATVEASTEGVYNLAYEANETYDLNNRKDGVYDLPGNSGEVYRISRRKSRPISSKANNKENETFGCVKTKKMKFLMLLIILIITAGAVAIAFYFNKFSDHDLCKDENWCSRPGVHLNCTVVLESCPESCGVCPGVVSTTTATTTPTTATPKTTTTSRTSTPTTPITTRTTNTFTSTAKYTLQRFNSSCCISSRVIHQTCNGGAMATNKCKEACDLDVLCKGYTIYLGANCNIYTTSACPNAFNGPYAPGNVGELNPHVTCLSTRYSGCYIKNTN